MSRSILTKVCLALVVTVMVACAAKPVWVKPGATPADFGADKYACMQGSATAAPAVAGINAYGSSSSNGYNSSGNFSANTHDINAGERDQMFTACMQAKGWSLQQPTQSPTSTNLPPANNNFAQAKSYCDGLYADPALDPIRSVIAINSSPTLEQQNNQNHIKNDQRPALDIYKTALGNCRNYLAKNDPHIWKLLMKAEPAPNENLKLLYDKKITIGEYNTRKEAIIEKIQAEVSDQIH